MPDKPPPDLAAVRAQLAQLRHAYHQELAHKRRELERLYAQAHGQTWHPSTLPPLLLALHKLAGSAGTFGFEHLSTLAHRAEEQVRRVQSQNSPMKPEEEVQLEQVLNVLLESWPEPI